MAIVPNRLPKHGEARSDIDLQTTQQIDLVDSSLDDPVNAVAIIFLAEGGPCEITIPVAAGASPEEQGTEYQDLVINLSDGERYVLVLSYSTSPSVIESDDRIDVAVTNNPANALASIVGFRGSYIA